jgi:GDP-L-fucose synthase
MKIIITGSMGLVGKTLQQLIQDLKADKTCEFLYLSSSLCDLKNYNNVLDTFTNFTPDIVIHLASIVYGLYGNMNSNFTMMIDNLKIHTNVLQACKTFKVKKLINILSTCVFPDSGITYPLTSDQILNGPPNYSNEGYAYSKRFLMTGSDLLSKETGMIVINLIPTNIYGSFDNYNIEKSHVIPGLIHKCYLAKKNNTSFVINGTGNAKRQFLYAHDFCKIIFQSITFNKNVNIVVSPPQTYELSIKQLVEKIVKKFDFKGPIIYDIQFSDGQYLKTSDSKEVLQNFEGFVFTNLEKGLSDTIAYFITNYPNIRK